MSSYLEIAEMVLAQRRRPMGPHAILREAYLLDLMPSHLHGETQHKTLQARLSEDILRSKERSRFVRTEPGKFFLRSLLSDETIPAEFRKTIKARRRKRELTPNPVLCIAKESLHKLEVQNGQDKWKVLESLRQSGELSYFEFKDRPEGHVPIWCFVMLMREECVLSYRVGKYRSHDDDVTSKRTVGFTSLVTEDQQTLFNHHDLGIIEAGITALALDLDFPMDVDVLDAETSDETSVVEVLTNDEIEAALLVIETGCPSWFEPTTRRLSMNDMKWIPFRVPPNHLDDFDPWTQAVVHRRFACDV
ncbi:winged helix-turn-helix domain-containing protein [Phaeobacter inhibens]|uniref:winged helix-turn-helix domain-containing protein n=1 Tax=Phaeobacter inhibens TaxID=221822 RepID=UPI0026E41838|nr:winged helix-turn-helix domain-containing protein [Phaeobacter inhibens]MDO6758110.1 winged helix-turn-helix domain-containing protein [Phaeobacter inhibens]